MSQIPKELAKFEYFVISFNEDKERVIKFYLTSDFNSFIHECTCKHLLELAEVTGSEGPDTSMCEELGSERLMLKFLLHSMCKKSDLFRTFPSIEVKRANELILIGLYGLDRPVVYSQPKISDEEKYQLLKDLAEHCAKSTFTIMKQESSMIDLMKVCDVLARIRKEIEAHQSLLDLHKKTLERHYNELYNLMR